MPQANIVFPPEMIEDVNEYAKGLQKKSANKLRKKSGITPRRRRSLNEALLDGASEGDLEKVTTALDKGADVNARDKSGWTALILAAYYGYFRVVEFLVSKGADVNAQNNDGDTALNWAAHYAEFSVVKFLVGKNANVNIRNKYGATALSFVIDRKIVQYLRAHGAKK